MIEAFIRIKEADEKTEERKEKNTYLIYLWGVLISFLFKVCCFQQVIL